MKIISNLDFKRNNHITEKCCNLWQLQYGLHFLFHLKKNHKLTEQSTDMICCLLILNYNTKLHHNWLGTRLNTQRQSLLLSPFYVVECSENHRMVEAGRDLWRLSSSASLLKQGQLEQAGQDCAQSCFEHLQAWRLQPPFWATCPSV